MLDKLVRYGRIEELLGPNPSGRILEVGAGPQGLGACLPYRFVGVDPWYPEPPVATQSAVRASGTALPFPDQTFEFVLCVEVLEHLPPEQRAQTVKELCRVASRRVVITHPFGRVARMSDRVLKWQYGLLRPFGVSRPWWIKEHFLYPFPKPGQYLPEELSTYSIQYRGQENAVLRPATVFLGNLKKVSRWLGRRFKHNPSSVRRWARRLDFPPYYRLTVVMDRRNGT